MGLLLLLLPVFIVSPIIIALVALNIVTISYGELGLSQDAAIALLIATLIGSMINIPISSKKIDYEEPKSFVSRHFYYAPPRLTKQIVVVNLGRAIIPTVFSIYLTLRAPLVPTLVATVAVILVARLFSRVVPDAGITMPAFIAPLVSAGLALLLARDHPAPVAFISGTMGTLIGADLLNWPNFKKLGSYMVSIGGAGVFDGVFLSGILAVAISSI